MLMIIRRALILAVSLLGLSALAQEAKPWPQAKPITWLDFAIGKIVSLVTVGFSVMGLPCVVFVLAHNALLPGWDLLMKSWWWIPASVGYSLVMVVPGALAILACSALIRSQGHAAITIIMISVVDGIFGPLLAGLLRDPRYLLVMFLVDQEKLGHAMFGRAFPPEQIHWHWAIGPVVGVCFVQVRPDPMGCTLVPPVRGPLALPPTPRWCRASLGEAADANPSTSTPAALQE